MRFVLRPEHRQLPLAVPEPELDVLRRPDEVSPAVQPGVPGLAAPVVNVLQLPDWEVAVHVAVDQRPLAQSRHSLSERSRVSRLDWTRSLVTS